MAASPPEPQFLMKLSSIRRRLFDTASPMDGVVRYLRYRTMGRSRPQGLQWARVVMHQNLVAELGRIGAWRLRVLEISPGAFWPQQEFRSYRAVGLPSCVI